jgi:nicotinate-nucleotide adenylyltransferase
MDRIGILGGTFDPIHLGHVIPAQYAFDYLRLDRLLLIPSAAPVHRPRHVTAPGEDRLRMCRLAAASLPHFSVCDIEVARPTPSYTVLTLRYFAEMLPPGTELILLVGEDNLPLLHTWLNIDEVFRLSTVVVLPRPHDGPADLSPLTAAIGKSAVCGLLKRRIPAPLIPISATDIRNRVHGHRPITGLVPRSVSHYIAEGGLYAAPDSSST